MGHTAAALGLRKLLLKTGQWIIKRRAMRLIEGDKEIIMLDG